MRNNRWVWVGVYLLATAVLAAGVIVLVKDQGTSDAATSATELADVAPMPFASSIAPVGPATGKVGDRMLFQAEGYTDGQVASVELWDGDRRIETQAVPGGTGALLTLPALSVGQHAVYAKVIDADGEASLTAPTPITIVADGTEPVVPVEVQADEDETVEQLAKRLDIDLERITVIAGGQDDVPVDTVKPLDLSPSDVIPIDAIVSAQPDGDAGLGDAVSGKAQAPSGEAKAAKGNLALSASTKGCSVTLTSTGGSGAIDYWDGAGSSVGWLRVGRSTGNDTVVLPAVTPGVHLYFATDGKGETPPLSVTMPPDCSKAVGWTGDVSITDGLLTVERQVPAGRRWLYLQVDGGTAIRVPATGSLPTAGFPADIGSLLPPLEGASMTVELWQGDDSFDRLVASGSLKAPDGTSISEIVGESRMLDLVLTDPAGAQAILQNQDRKLTFTWNAGPRIEAVMYQVLVHDQPITQVTLPPEERLLTGVSVRKDAGTTGSGTFTIDTADIPGRTATGRDLASVTPVYPAPVPAVIGTKVTSNKKPKVVTPIGPDTAARESEAPVLMDLPTFGDDVWVRAIGLSSGGAGTVTASNTVRVRLPTPQGVDGGSVDFVSGTDFGPTEWKPGHIPRTRSFGDCVWASVSWDGPVTFPEYDGRSAAGNTARIEAMSAAYPQDGTYCPQDFPPPPPPTGEDCSVPQIFCNVWAGIEAVGGLLLSALEAVYGFVTTVLNTVVNGIANAIAKYSGVCEALEKVAEGSKKTCGTVLVMVVKAVIQAVLAAVGIPPLPDLSVLEAVAKGDFAAVAVTLMEIAGIPCSSFKPDPDVGLALDAATGLTGKGAGVAAAIKDPCLAMASALVATVKSQVLSKAQVTLAQSTGVPYTAINHKDYPFSLVPSPLGKPGPTSVTLRMQPRDDNADAGGRPCILTVRIVNVTADGKERTVVPGQTIVVPELPAPNKGRWEKRLVLTSTAKEKDLYGTWHLRASPIVESTCRLEPIDLAAQPPLLPNYAKDRKKGQPTTADARPSG